MTRTEGASLDMRYNLANLPLDAFLDTSGTKTSGEVKGQPVLFHFEEISGLQPNPGMPCAMDVGFTGTNGAECKRHARREYYRPTKLLNSTN